MLDSTKQPMTVGTIREELGIPADPGQKGSYHGQRET